MALARKILTRCYYGRRDGEIRCLESWLPKSGGHAGA
jgi:hypothetical protein